MTVKAAVLSGAKWPMPGQYRCLSALLLMTSGVTVAHAAEKSQSICTSGELVRRVVVDVGDLGTSLPCEVVYWKDTEAPGVRRVLWNAGSDAAFCDGKAAGLVDKLASAGWRCDKDGVSTSSSAAPATGAQPAAAPSAAVPSIDAATVGAPEASGAQTGVPQPQTTAALSTDLAPTPAPGASSLPAPSPSPEPSPSNGTTAGAQDLRTAALAPSAPTAAAPIDQLETVIQTNLSSLNQSVDGDFQAQIGDFGDLNADGIDDAVVFFNYESSTADFTQFVAAYLFDGESYHLAATKPVGGTDLAVRKVEVDTIVDGSIQLRLLLNDASQTEDRRAAMILKDGQLVETE